MDTKKNQKDGVGGEVAFVTLTYWLVLIIFGAIMLRGQVGSDFNFGHELAVMIHEPTRLEAIRPELTIALVINMAAILFLVVFGDSIRKPDGHIECLDIILVMLIVTGILFILWQATLVPMVKGFLSYPPR